MKSFPLDKYITDTDSHLQFSAKSSDAAVASVPELNPNERSITITAKGVGTATITVEARDGDNDPVEAQISVTVVRSNNRPTTNDLSKLDRDKLEKRLYVVEGSRDHTVTVVAMPGSTSSETLTDKISDTFKVAYGAKKESKSDLVSVKVTKGTGANQYDIAVTPTTKSLGKGPVKIMIYPMDMFGAASEEAWEFNAMFNTTPKELVDSFGTIRLHRPAAPTDTAVPALDIETTTSSTINAKTLKIADYFDFASLQRMTVAGTPADVTDAQLATIDMIGDTSCEVTVDTTLAVVQMLNEAGQALADAGDGAVTSAHLRSGNQALAAIRIDSRVSALGSDGVVSVLTAPAAVALTTDDTLAKGEGAFDIVIRCTDNDDTAEVTGRVVVQQM